MSEAKPVVSHNAVLYCVFINLLGPVRTRLSNLIIQRSSLVQNINNKMNSEFVSDPTANNKSKIVRKYIVAGNKALIISAQCIIFKQFSRFNLARRQFEIQT